MTVDFTDRKHADDAVPASEQRFRTFVEHAADAFFLLDERLQILDVNSQACESLGYERQELVGMLLSSLASGITPSAFAEARDGQRLAFESRHRRKDGTTFPVEIRGQRFREGGQERSVALARDVSERERAGLALRESEERFRSTFENAGAGIALCDVQGNFLRVNQTFSDITGHLNEDLVGRTYRAITHPEDVDIDRPQIAQLLRGDIPHYSVEKRYIKKDGTTVRVTLSASIHRDLELRPVGLIAVIQDITERWRLEEELRKAKQRLDIAVHGSSLTIWEFDMPDGRIEACTASFINVWEPLGFDASEMPSGFLDAFAFVIHPDDQARVAGELQAALVGSGLEFESEYRVRQKNGTHRWTLARGSILRDQHGTPIRLAGSSVDITELKRVEAALRESEERFRGTFENAAVGMAHVDPAGHFLRINQKYADIVGYPRERLIGSRSLDVTHPDDVTSAEQYLSRLSSREVQSYSHERRVISPDGETSWINMSASFQHDADGAALHSIEVIQDISDRKRLEADLRHAKDAAEAANRAKDEFLANVSHEIRTPMNAILGMTELVLDTPLTDDQRLSLKTVQSAADSLLGLINDLLDFSKIEAGKFELEADDFSLRAVVGDTLRALAMRAHRKGLELVSRVHSEVPDTLVGDPVRLRQVVLNLVGNAIKFTERGEVGIAVRVAGVPATEGKIVLTFAVHDTGIGISRDKQQAIFLAFEQEDSSTTRKYGGTGLGLTISAQIAKLMKGTLTVESERGTGSVFTLSAEFGVRSGAHEPALAEPPVPLQGKRALVVDDNASNRRILVEWLTRWQLQPTAIGDGPAAVDALWDATSAGRPFDFVLLDASMPGMDGLDIVELIRKHPPLSSTRVVLLTSNERPYHRARRGDLQVQAQLLKPVEPAELLATIYRVLGGSSPPSAEGHDAREHELGAGVAPLNVLVAEDNEFNAQLMTALLVRRGHHVRVARNGSEALALATSESFDLLLLDIQMPQMNGLDVVRAIRKHESATLQHLYVVALTARSREADREHCLASGMDDFLAKPIRGADLWNVTRRLERASADAGATTSRARALRRRLLNAEGLLAACGSDPTILAAICASLATHLPVQLAQLSEALQAGDSQRLFHVAHQLAGMLGTFSNEAASDVSRLEDLAEAGRIAECQPLIAHVQTQARDLLLDLAGVTIERLRADLAGE